MTDSSQHDHGLRGLGYTVKGDLHVIPADESFWSPDLVEKKASPCGRS